MASGASVEIWAIILKYAINVPLFLDSDPLESNDIDILHQYSYQDSYWKSERVRNSLRRVCSTWDAFLRTYNHRFIRMEDILRKRVPVTAIPSAIRMELNMDCRCRDCSYSSTVSDHMEQMVDTWITAMWGQPGQSKKANWKLEILDGWLNPRSEYATTLKRVAPRLRVMLAQPASILTLKEDALPNLAILTADILSRRPSVNTAGLTSLTVLHLSVTALGDPLNKNDVSSLRHLTIDIRGNWVAFTPQGLCAFLQDVGPQLETFYARNWLISLKIEPEVWNVLSGVKRIQLPFPWNDCELPPYHPLQHVQISNEEFRRYCFIDDPDPRVTLFLPPGSSKRAWKVRLDTTWTHEFYSNSKFIVWMMGYCEKKGISITDAHGDTFAAYIVFLIRAFWKQPRRRYWVAARSGGCLKRIQPRYRETFPGL